MKIYQYLILNDESQYNVLWDIGTFIDDYKEDNIVYQLYAINDFFIELYFDIVENKVVDKFVFKQGDRLEKYLPK